MECSLKKGLTCCLDDVYGACFYCKKVDEDAVSSLPVLETDLVHFMEEG